MQKFQTAFEQRLVFFGGTPERADAPKQEKPEGSKQLTSKEKAAQDKNHQVLRDGVPGELKQEITDTEQLIKDRQDAGASAEEIKALKDYLGTLKDAKQTGDATRKYETHE